MRHPHHHGRGPRVRSAGRPGHWDVRARVERFAEPALLLLLRERPMHGYELLDRLPELVGSGRPARIDLGNLYRLLRSLEADGLVTSEWSAGPPGPARRIYRLTPGGRRLLDRWADALRKAQEDIAAFLRRYEEHERR